MSISLFSAYKIANILKIQTQTDKAVLYNICAMTSLSSSLGGLYASLGYKHCIYSQLSTVHLKNQIHQRTLLLQWRKILFLCYSHSQFKR